MLKHVIGPRSLCFIDDCFMHYALILILGEKEWYLPMKGGGALRRLWEKNFEAIVLVLKIGLGG